MIYIVILFLAVGEGLLINLKKATIPLTPAKKTTFTIEKALKITSGEARAAGSISRRQAITPPHQSPLISSAERRRIMRTMRGILKKGRTSEAIKPVQ